jgi:glycerol-3-phosphate dehydrogenase
MDERNLHRLIAAYGTRVKQIIGAAGSEADLGRSFGAGLTEAELSYLMTEEWARTAEDILWRRSKLGLQLTPEQIARVDQFVSANTKVHVM